MPETDWSPMVRSIFTGRSPSRIGLGVGRCGLLSLAFPGEVFLLGVSQHLRQLGITVVVGQGEDHLRIGPGIGARDRFVHRQPFSPTRPRLQPEDLRRYETFEDVTADLPLFIDAVYSTRRLRSDT